MAVSSEYLDYVHDQLSGLGGVTSRRMFGGAGLYCDEFFLALIDNDTLYLRVNDALAEPIPLLVWFAEQAAHEGL